MDAYSCCGLTQCKLMQNSERRDDLQQRLKLINCHFTYSLYVSICSSLFERHKLVFSMLLATRIRMSQNLLSSSRLNFLLTGATGPTHTSRANPAPCAYAPATLQSSLGLHALLLLYDSLSFVLSGIPVFPPPASRCIAGCGVHKVVGSIKLWGS